MKNSKSMSQTFLTGIVSSVQGHMQLLKHVFTFKSPFLMTSLCQIAVKWIYWLIRRDLNLIQKIFDNKSGNYAFVNRSRMMSHLSLWVDWQTIREDCICKTRTLLFSHLKASAPCSGMPIQTISPHFLFFWQNVGLLLIQLAVQESGSNKHHRASLSAYPGKASAYPRTEEINTSGCSSLKKHSGGGRGREAREGGSKAKTAPRRHELGPMSEFNSAPTLHSEWPYSVKAKCKLCPAQSWWNTICCSYIFPQFKSVVDKRILAGIRSQCHKGL